MNRVLMTGVLASFSLLTGCAMFKQKIETKDPATATPLQATYDQRDLLEWADTMAQKIIADPFVAAIPERPILVDMGIENRTQTHLDTKAIADTITTKLMDARRFRLINASQRDNLLKEQGYQLANCTKETRCAIGKQLGARYMLSGSLVEINAQSGRAVRASKKQDVFYQLTLDVTDLESGEVAVRKQENRLRRESRPIFGW